MTLLRLGDSFGSECSGMLIAYLAMEWTLSMSSRISTKSPRGLKSAHEASLSSSYLGMCSQRRILPCLLTLLVSSVESINTILFFPSSTPAHPCPCLPSLLHPQLQASPILSSALAVYLSFSYFSLSFFSSSSFFDFTFAFTLFKRAHLSRSATRNDGDRLYPTEVV